MEFTAEQIAAAISTDPRIRLVAQGADIKAQLEAQGPLRAIMEVIGTDADAAMKEFAEADLGDDRAIKTLQARVYRNHVALKTFDAIINKALQAQDAIRGEAPAEDDMP